MVLTFLVKNYFPQHASVSRFSLALLKSGSGCGCIRWLYCLIVKFDQILALALLQSGSSCAAESRFVL